MNPGGTPVPPLAAVLVLEQLLCLREEDWERALDTIPDAIAICDERGRVVKSNRALRDILCRSRDELHQQPIDGLLLPLSLRAQVDEALKSGGVTVCESPPGQGRSYTATISPIKMPTAPAPCPPLGPPTATAPGPPGPFDGEMPARPAPFAALLLLRDVTDERRLQRRLVLGERMAAVGQLAAGLAHEINNPVSAAYSNLQLATDLLLRHKDVLPPSLADLFEMLEDCRVGMSRVRDIVRDLRDFTSTEVKSAAGEVRLDDIIDLGLRLSRSQVQRRARLIYDRDLSPMPLIRGDAGKLSHMLMNLISQALHNLPTSADPARRRQAITVRTRIDRAGGQVELVVADTGPTLSEQIRAHLFEPFAQRRERLPAAVSAALGMGLAVSYEVVQRHGGDIEARPGPPGDEPGCGNQLIVRLPFSRSEDLGNSGPALVQGARLRLLFIDEDPGQQRAYKEQVGDLHEVVTASSAKEALSLFDAGETFDVVFCNLSLVAGSGVGLHREVAARDAALAGRFVFVGSGPPEGRSYVEMLHLHCIDGPDRAALLSAVAAVMHPHPG